MHGDEKEVADFWFTKLLGHHVIPTTPQRLALLYTPPLFCGVILKGGITSGFLVIPLLFFSFACTLLQIFGSKAAFFTLRKVAFSGWLVISIPPILIAFSTVRTFPSKKSHLFFTIAISAGGDVVTEEFPISHVQGTPNTQSNR